MRNNFYRILQQQILAIIEQLVLLSTELRELLFFCRQFYKKNLYKRFSLKKFCTKKIFCKNFVGKIFCIKDLV